MSEIGKKIDSLFKDIFYEDCFPFQEPYLSPFTQKVSLIVFSEKG